MNHNPYNKCMKKYLLSFLIILSGTILAKDTVANIFKVNYKNQLFMDVEVALAEAQSELGIIPSWAANEISSKADIKYLSQKDIDMEHKLVRHTLVARLNVWKRSIDKDAAEYLQVSSEYFFPLTPSEARKQYGVINALHASKGRIWCAPWWCSYERIQPQ